MGKQMTRMGCFALAGALLLAGADAETAQDVAARIAKAANLKAQ